METNGQITPGNETMEMEDEGVLCGSCYAGELLLSLGYAGDLIEDAKRPGFYRVTCTNPDCSMRVGGIFATKHPEVFAAMRPGPRLTLRLEPDEVPS